MQASEWATPSAVALLLGALVAAATALAKDRRERNMSGQDTAKRRFDLDVDMRVELDKLWRVVHGQRKALLVVAQKIRTDADAAVRAGDLSAAAAHRIDAARIEDALVIPD